METDDEKYSQNLMERIRELGYQDIEQIIPANGIMDIDSSIRKLLKGKEEEFLNAVSSGIENPLEKVIQLSRVIFDMSTRKKIEDITITQRIITWDTIEFPINVATESSLEKTSQILAIRNNEDSRIPWQVKNEQRAREKRPERNPLYCQNS